MNATVGQTAFFGGVSFVHSISRTNEAKLSGQSQYYIRKPCDNFQEEIKDDQFPNIQQ